MIVKTHAYPRAGLIGNPSDGYFGKTIAFTFSNFKAGIELWESPELELLPSRRDHSLFKSLDDLHDDVRKHGYYGGFRLLKASCKRFVDYCAQNGIKLDNRNFTLRYASDIPNRVGLAGSSAIITSCMRALMAFYNVEIQPAALANLVLSVEIRELSIPAGLQDRVAQAYQGFVKMDFNRELMEKRGYGEYEVLDGSSLKGLYIAYSTRLSQGTEILHSDLRSRWKKGDKAVVQAMKDWADLTDRFVAAMEAGNRKEMHACLNQNFDIRDALVDVGDGNKEMVKTAREAGASAKFAGSGGAIVGLYDSEDSFKAMKKAFEPKEIVVFKPKLVGM